MSEFGMQDTLDSPLKSNKRGGATEEHVIVCFPFIGDRLGGSHVSALGLIKNLDRTRFKPLVVLHEQDGPVAEFFRREGVAFEAAPTMNRLERAKLRNAGAALNILRTLPAFIAFLRSHKVAIVHTNDGRTHVAWGMAAKLAGAKLLWHHRGDNSAIGMRLIAPWLANRVASVSKFSVSSSGFFSAARKTTVVFSPFDIEKSLQFDRKTSRDMVLAATSEAADTHLLGYVGTLVARKRPLVFVETIAELKTLAPQQRFAGVFLGPALNELDEAAHEKARQLGIADRIHFLGYRYPGEAWIAGLDALLVPSVGEPLGRTLVEAMLLGTPVIASNSGGNPEAITDGKTGKIVEPDNPRAFAEAYLDLIRRPSQLPVLIENARREARGQFSAKRHVDVIAGLYEGMIRARGEG